MLVSLCPRSGCDDIPNALANQKQVTKGAARRSIDAPPLARERRSPPSQKSLSASYGLEDGSVPVNNIAEFKPLDVCSFVTTDRDQTFNAITIQQSIDKIFDQDQIILSLNKNLMSTVQRLEDTKQRTKKIDGLLNRCSEATHVLFERNKSKEEEIERLKEKLTGLRRRRCDRPLF